MCGHHIVGEAKEGPSEKVCGSSAGTNTGTPYVHLEVKGKNKREGWREAEFQAGWGNKLFFQFCSFPSVYHCQVSHAFCG